MSPSINTKGFTVFLFNEQMFFVAYQRMCAKPGNMTPGTDGKTEDEMSIGQDKQTHREYKDETYSPQSCKENLHSEKEWEDASARNTVF